MVYTHVNQFTLLRKDVLLCTPPLFIFYFITSFGIFATAKILTQDKLNLRESIYLLLATLILSALLLFGFLFSFTTSMITISEFIIGVATIAFVIVYFTKLKSYSIKKAMALTVIMYSVTVLMQTFFFMIGLPIHPGQFELEHEVWSLFWNSLVITLTQLIITALLLKLVKRLKIYKNDNDRLLATFARVGGLIILLSHIIWMIINLNMPYSPWTTEPILTSVVIVAFSMVFTTGFMFYFRRYIGQQKIKLREAEQDALKYYTEELEKQQISIQKFKHDTQNIMLSMEGFIRDKDMDGLEQYYYNKIKVASEVITKNSFATARLSKIKVKEIKSVLLAKLVAAQNTALGIDVTFEADVEIDYIPMDSVVLVRMLGIILDNSIEALEELGKGQLLVACLKEKETINFVVQNTCKVDLPKLSELQKVGFSTKGSGRGLGLDNLSELADSCSNVTLWTSIHEDRFTQKLIIGEV